MVQVEIWGSMRSATGGEATVEVEARTIRELLDRLAERHPGLRPQLDKGVSVSIDGQIYRDAWFKKIEPESEVVLLPRLAGG